MARSIGSRTQGAFLLRDIYSSLFSVDHNESDQDSFLRLVRAPLDARVILECLHVLVREQRASQGSGSIISNPLLHKIGKGLLRLHWLINNVWILSHTERLQL